MIKTKRTDNKVGTFQGTWSWSKDLIALITSPDLVSNVTTNTATIWSFSSHCSLASRPGKGTARSRPQSTVCGRPEPPSPRATTAVPHLAGAQVTALGLPLRPVLAWELFFRGGASWSRGGGHAWFGSGGGISSQSRSGARSDCFTIMLQLRVDDAAACGGFQSVGRRDNSPLFARLDGTRRGAGAGSGSWFPAAWPLVFYVLVSVSHPLTSCSRSLRLSHCFDDVAHFRPRVYLTIYLIPWPNCGSWEIILLRVLLIVWLICKGLKVLL